MKKLVLVIACFSLMNSCDFRSQSHISEENLEQILSDFESEFSASMRKIKYNEAKKILDDWQNVIENKDEKYAVNYLLAKSRFYEILKRKKESYSNLIKAKNIALELKDTLAYVLCLRQYFQFSYKYETDLTETYFLRLKNLCDSTKNESICDIHLNNLWYKAYMDSDLPSLKKYHIHRGQMDSLGKWTDDFIIDRFNYSVQQIADGHLDEAKENFQHIEQVSLALKDSATLGNTYRNLAHIYRDKNQITRAKNYFETAELYIKKTKDYNLLTHLYEEWYDVEFKSGNIEKALVLKNRELENNYNVYERALSENSSMQEQHLEIISKENEIIGLNESKKKEQALLWLGILSLCFISGLLYFLNRASKKQKENLEKLLKEQEAVKKLESESIEHEYESRLIKSNLQFSDNLHRSIAMKLHDELGSTLAGLKLKLSVFSNSNNELALNDMIESLDQSYKYTRDLSHSLKPPNLDKESYSSFLENYLDDTIRLIPSQADIIIENEDLINSIPEFLFYEIYRILQELIINVGKHAKASRVAILIVVEDDRIKIKLKDNGVGLDYNERAGIGIDNIEKRIDILHGDFQLDSTIGQGTEVEIMLPLQ